MGQIDGSKRILVRGLKTEGGIELRQSGEGDARRASIAVDLSQALSSARLFAAAVRLYESTITRSGMLTPLPGLPEELKPAPQYLVAMPGRFAHHAVGALALRLRMGILDYFPRAERSRHGPVEGAFVQGSEVVLVGGELNDVVFPENMRGHLAVAGLTVRGMTTILNSQNGTQARLHEAGLQTHSAIPMSDIAYYLCGEGFMDDYTRSLVYDGLDQKELRAAS